jgi:hypothetical protein
LTKHALDQFIETETPFITDIEQIVDTIYNAERVYFYDTSAISSHEITYKKYNDLLFFTYSENDPILITETIANEMDLIQDHEYRYLTYLSKFRKVLYVKERDIINLLKVDYETPQARSKFLIASERAFSSIQWLKEKVDEARKNFTEAEQIVTSAFQTFFMKNNNKNKGEVSLLWVSTMVEHIAPRTKVIFVGIDHDLYDFVERCYFTSVKKRPFADNIYFLSNDTLLQSYFRKASDIKSLSELIPIYRNPDRKTRFQKRVHKVLNLNQQKEKISNEDFFDFVVREEIEIIY